MMFYPCQRVKRRQSSQISQVIARETPSNPGKWSNRSRNSQKCQAIAKSGQINQEAAGKPKQSRKVAKSIMKQPENPINREKWPNRLKTMTGNKKCGKKYAVYLLDSSMTNPALHSIMLV